jgi:glycopeptide antibiotics resistance protein
MYQVPSAVLQMKTHMYTKSDIVHLLFMVYLMMLLFMVYLMMLSVVWTTALNGRISEHLNEFYTMWNKAAAA